ncbi:trigger factor [Firmicutes bacterium CAG:552]|nr:trigger factor [Firmicutes bacterium CAG:552]
MNYQVEKKEGSVKFTFTVSHDEWESEIEQTYLKTKGKYSVPGFRKGHATRKMIENFYGQSVFFDDAINNCVRKGYSKALDENEDIFPVDEPQVDIAKFDDKELVFTVEVVVKPEVQLGKYTGIKLDKVEYTVKQSDVKAELERARERLSRNEEVSDRALKNGDTANIDYSGSVDGVKFVGGTAEKQDLVICSKTFIPGFEEQLIGMNVGDSKDITVKFPEEYHAKDLAGKDAVFAVKLNSITVKVLPELNDAFAQEASKFDTLAEYKEDIKKTLTENAKSRAEAENENNLIKAIVDDAKVEIPDAMIETQLDYIVQDFSYRLSYAYRGMKFEDYLKYSGTTMEEFRKDRREEALNTVKTRLTLEAVIKAANIEVSQEDLEAKVKELADQTKKSVEEVKASGQLPYIRNEILMTRTMDFLKENNSFVAKEKKTKEQKEETSAQPEEKEGTTKTEAPKKKTTKKSVKKEDKAE